MNWKWALGASLLVTACGAGPETPVDANAEAGTTEEALRYCETLSSKPLLSCNVDLGDPNVRIAVGASSVRSTCSHRDRVGFGVVVNGQNGVEATVKGPTLSFRTKSQVDYTVVSLGAGSDFLPPHDRISFIKTGADTAEVEVDVEIDYHFGAEGFPTRITGRFPCEVHPAFWYF